VSPLLHGETDSPRDMQEHDSPYGSEIGTLVSHSGSTVISPKNPAELDSAGGGGRGGASGALSADPLMQTAPAGATAAGLSGAAAEADAALRLMSSSGPLAKDKDRDKESLRARLGMSARERRSTRIPVTQRLRNLPKGLPLPGEGERGGLPPSVAAAKKPSAHFEWGGGLGHGLLLFMVHDNHMLGDTLAAMVLGADSDAKTVVAKRPTPVIPLPGAGAAETGSEGAGVAVMLESKDDSGASVFVLGTIIYSGDMSSIKGADGSNPRGAQCMVIGGVQAIRAKLKDFPTRSRPGNSDIKEMDLAGLPGECYARVSDSAELRGFLQQCRSRVDVILDPSRSEPSWYPYWEGSRKMAPQFRSKGIGYIRLGDDMSMNGTAFLSTDAGVTFMDDGTNSVVDAPKAPSAPSVSSPSSNYRKMGSMDPVGDADGKAFPRAHTPGGTAQSPRRVGSSYGGTAAMRHIIQNLRNADAPTTTANATIPANLTWSQRVELLQRMQKELRLLATNLSTAYTPRTPDATSAASGEWVADAFGIIADSLVKQKNPNVLKESLACVPLFSPWIPSPASMDLLPSNAPPSASANMLAWRMLFMEVVHCLRHANKNASDSAKLVLNDLETNRAITFLSVARLYPCPFTELLSGPVRGNTARPAPTSAGSIATAANTARVLSWLVGLTRSVARESAGAARSGGHTDDDYYHGAPLFKALKPLLFHREEATRDGAVSLMAMLVCYDELSAKKPHAPAPKLTESPRARQNSAKSLLTVVESTPTSQNPLSLPEGLSAGTMQLLREVDETSAKTCARIIRESVVLADDIKSEPVDVLVAVKVVSTTTKTPSPGDKPRRLSRASLGAQGERDKDTASGNMTTALPSVRFEKTLTDEWFEAKYLLKSPPTDESSWNQLTEVS
jgi:hypothetical protein